MSKVRTIGRNISFLGLNRIVGLIISFLLFPFIIKHVGKELYGVYLLVLTINGYFGLLDLSFMSATSKFVSEYNGKNDRETINRIINASFSFYSLIGLIMAFTLFMCAIYFNLFFKIEPSNLIIARKLFIIAGISNLFFWPSSAFRYINQGLNLWHIEAVVNIIIQVCSAIFTIFLLPLGFGIVSLFIVLQFLNIAANIIFYFVIKERMKFKIKFPFLDIGTYRFMFKFSIFLFLSSIINIFIFQAHNLIIGYFLSMSSITLYAVSYNIQNYFRSINSAIGSPPWTVASEMEGRRDYEGQRKLLFKGTRYMSAVFLPIVLITFFFARPFINYWMGPDFDGSVLPARIIILFWLFNGTLEIASGMLSAKGIVKTPLFVQSAVACLNIIISISLVRVLGITAIALGLTISMVFVGFPFILRLSLATLKISFKEYFYKTIFVNLRLYLLVILLCLLVIRYFYPFNLHFTLLEMAVIYFSTLAFYFLLNLTKTERAELIKLVGIK